MHDTIYRVEPVLTADTGVRTVTVVTNGAVGAQGEAEECAREAFGTSPVLARRTSGMGELVFVFTDRALHYWED